LSIVILDNDELIFSFQFLYITQSCYLYRFFTNKGQRIFNFTIEGVEFTNVDIVAIAGTGQRAITLGATITVLDGHVSISVGEVENEPKMNGIEIRRALPHLAHAVSNGPYYAVDSDNDGYGYVQLDGSESHTHAPDLELVQWTWREGRQTIASSEKAYAKVPVGEHDVDFTVLDSGGNEATESTTITVYPFGFPAITKISPMFGSLLGGEVVTIMGTGFDYDTTELIVRFGVEQITGSVIQFLNSTAITVLSPHVPISAPVPVSVETPLGRSEDVTFTYASSTPISFSTKLLLNFSQPTSASFGPDGKLYVGSIKGILAKITMNANYTLVTSMVTAMVQPDRAILGIAFDPMDAGNPIPPIYISSSKLFHGGNLSSSGTSVNGKINRISGANLDVVEDIVTGLPVCDSDHGTY
jgi:IPT/TIG domain